MLAHIRACCALFVLLSLVTGVAYPLIVTGIGQLFFARQAEGSLIEQDGKLLGSSLIGQPFDAPEYFWGRLSATSNADGALPYNGASSSGSNLGPLNPALIEAVKQRIAALEAADPDGNAEAKVPVDLVTSSGSGLDPHISPAAAEYQVARVARVRGLSVEQVRAIVARHTRGRTLGLLGEPRVNVLMLNLDLDALAQQP